MGTYRKAKVGLLGTFSISAGGGIDRPQYLSLLEKALDSPAESSTFDAFAQDEGGPKTAENNPKKL